ncbi:hypothetical protein [Bradyrhizobium sp. CCBAU 51753]|uniref:hypothetical protein n=1 Tax=Bradyrhizobium sp. CCBAU 51753 TaxID=1325100 RepID=UPI00188C18C3|nr:hypothetical protein [Bradyrhizobium sp. CCBAU 51753]QOZ24140.1 hypothetical protein XH93_11560 [Bradyrhizobium sp. CCBAU 51753]
MTDLHLNKKESGSHRADGRAGLSGAALVAALVVLSAWLLLLAWLAFNTAVEEVAWSRLLVVLGSLEAVTFGAAGALFGTHIQRQRVEDARQRAAHAEANASKAEEKAASNSDAAIKGKTLATVIKAKARARSGPVGSERLSASGGGDDRDEVLDLAHELFPD